MTTRTLLLLLGVSGCQPTVSIGTNARTDGDSSDSTGTTTTNMVAAATTETGLASTSLATSESNASSTMGDDGFLGGACQPTPSDSECVACAKQSCCAVLELCATDFGCGCGLGCLQYPALGCPCPANEIAEQLFGCLLVGCDALCPP